jgi:hypothetical protein
MPFNFFYWVGNQVVSLTTGVGACTDIEYHSVVRASDATTAVEYTLYQGGPGMWAFGSEGIP